MTIFLFSICPSLVVYSNIATPDHMTILLMTIIIYLWSKLLKLNNMNKRKLLLTLLLIIFMCLINLFKPLSYFMLLVFIGSELLNNFRNRKAIQKYFKYNFKYTLFFIFSFIILNLAISNLLNFTIENTMKTKVISDKSSYLIWGYTIDDKGEYNSDFIYQKLYTKLLKKYDNNLDKLYEEMSAIAKQNLKNNINYLPKIWLAKYKLAVGHEGDFFSFANTNNNSNYSKRISYKYNDFLMLGNSFMSICYLFMGLACLFSVVKQNKQKELSIVLLMIIGYLAILVLGGVQPRYKSLIFPQIFIVSALGINYFMSLFKHFIINIKKNKGSVIINVGISDNSSI